MSIIEHVTLQKIVAHDFRYDPRISNTKCTVVYAGYRIFPGVKWPERDAGHPGCAWSGAVPPPAVCVCKGMPCGDLYPCL